MRCKTNTTMHLKQRLFAFVSLGSFLNEFLHAETIENTDNELIDELNNLVQNIHFHNPWFTPKFVREALTGIAKMLEKEKLEQWIEKYYQIEERLNSPKQISVIMAGNIPMVGFHDALCVLLSGNKLIAKLSSDDNKLIPFLFKVLVRFEPEFANYFRFEDGIVKDADAFIATGSNNSARYFEHYFGKYPHIIRKNRSSIAIITGKETDEELAALGKDVFYYFGLGCRNVSLLLIPENFSIVRLLDNFRSYDWMAEHNKYMNNYDYRRSIALLNKTHHFDNGFLLLFEKLDVHANIGSLHYNYYENENNLKSKLGSFDKQLQCIVGNESDLCNATFGKAQYPEIDEYADGVDTMKFLLTLNH